jgi:hypothetical protein
MLAVGFDFLVAIVPSAAADDVRGALRADRGGP